MIWGRGCKTYGGRKTYQTTRSPENFWTPPKSFWSALSWILVQENRALTPEGSGKTYRTRGGGPKPLLGGVSFVRFSTPLFFPPPPPPWRPLTRVNSVQTRCIVKGEVHKSPLFWRFWGVFDFLRIACSLGIPQENL